MGLPSSPHLLFSPQTKKLLSMRQERWDKTGLSDLNAVAEGEADAAVGVNRCMIQQLSPGLRVECRHLLRETFQSADELLSSSLGGNHSGDLPGHLVVLSLDAIIPGGQFIVSLLVFLLVEGDVRVFVDAIPLFLS